MPVAAVTRLAAEPGADGAYVRTPTDGAAGPDEAAAGAPDEAAGEGADVAAGVADEGVAGILPGRV